MAARSRYGKVTDDLVALLTEIVGDRNVLTGDERENYSRDETPKLKPVVPAVAVKPEDTDSVAKILKLANERKSQSPHNRRCGFIPYLQVLLFGNPPPWSPSPYQGEEKDLVCKGALPL